jgi:hypothetical protein
MSEPALDHDDTRILFDIRGLLARLVALVEGGEDDGEEEEEGKDEPRS